MVEVVAVAVVIGSAPIRAVQQKILPTALSASNAKYRKAMQRTHHQIHSVEVVASDRTTGKMDPAAMAVTAIRSERMTGHVQRRVVEIAILVFVPNAKNAVSRAQNRPMLAATFKPKNQENSIFHPKSTKMSCSQREYPPA